MDIHYYSLIVGVVASLIVWWITNKCLSPWLKISSNIARTPKGNFQVGIMNCSHWREVYDIGVYIRYHFSSGNYYAEKIEHVPLLKRRPIGDTDRILEKQRPFAIKLLINGYKDPKGQLVSVDDFFKANTSEPQGYIDIFVVAYDRLSGSTRHIVNRRYYHKDVLEDHIIENDSVCLKHANENFGVQSKFYDNNS